MKTIIKEVTTKKQLKKWVDFPNVLYKNVEAYVPFLMVDEIGTFTKSQNPAYDFCETKLFLAYQGNKIVGRIAGLINHAANKKWEQSRIRFTRFDFIDDYDVSRALYDEVAKWGRENGLTEMTGPIGFTDMDHEGMLVEGFDELNMSITFYNFPYYLKHMEKLGFEKDVDWVEFKIEVPKEPDEKISRLNDFLIKRSNYKVVKYTNQKDLVKDAYEAFKVIDEAFSVLHGTVPLTDRIIDQAIKDNVSMMNLKYILSVKDESDKIIGFAVLVPSIAKALKKSNGRLLPFGIFRILKAVKCKNDTLEMYFIAVSPEHQKKGVPVIVMNEMMKVLIDNGVKYCETGPELEDNKNVQSMWKGFSGTRNHKRRRCYIKKIAD